MATINVTDENFDEKVLKSDKPVLVDFWAEWCGPCKMVGPILEEISNEMAEEVVVAKHDIDSQPNVPTRYSIRGCLLYTSPSPRDTLLSRMPSSA